jgi:SnoaL-like protein
MSQTIQEKNRALVLEAFDALFNRRDYAAAERFWSPSYIQHSAHIAPGREGLFNLVRSLPPTLKYEPGLIVADGDFVIVHGRFSGFGAPASWISADSSESRVGSSSSIGMSSRTKRLKSNPKAAGRCSATRSPCSCERVASISVREIAHLSHERGALQPATKLRMRQVGLDLLDHRPCGPIRLLGFQRPLRFGEETPES